MKPVHFTDKKGPKTIHKLITPARLQGFCWFLFNDLQKSEDFRGKNSPIIKCVRLISVHFCSQYLLFKLY